MYPVSPPGSFRLASLNYIWQEYTWEKGEHKYKTRQHAARISY